MKIRPIRPLSETEYADDRTIPKRIYAAEQRFLRALEREARGSNKPTSAKITRAAPVTPRAQGRAAGAAFAQISRADYSQAASYTRAIQAGVREASREDEEARNIAASAGALRAMGFPASDNEDDF